MELCAIRVLLLTGAAVDGGALRYTADDEKFPAWRGREWGKLVGGAASHNLFPDRCYELYRSLTDSMRAAGGSAGSIIEAAAAGRSRMSGRTIRSTNNTR